MNEIFLIVNRTQICNYADDTTINACNRDLSTIISNLEEDSSALANWFSNSAMKINDDI